MYPPSMLSSAALAAAAQGLQVRPDHQYNIANLTARLQMLARIENVSPVAIPFRGQSPSRLHAHVLSLKSCLASTGANRGNLDA